MSEELKSGTDTHTIGSQNTSRKLPPHAVRYGFIGLILLLLVSGLFLALTGRLAVSIKQPDQRMVVRSEVCGEAIVARYNKAVSAVRPSDPTPSEVTKLVKEFSAVKGYENDPTCLYIKFHTLLDKGTYAEANNIYQTMLKLANQGNFANTKLYNMAGLDSMKYELSAIKPVDTSNPGKDLTEVGND